VKERRKAPRLKCRIPCAVRRGRDRIPASILDVSQGGLCLLSPVSIERGDGLAVLIEVSGSEPIELEATAWHSRVVTTGASRRRAWSVGAMILKADDGYQALLADFDQEREVPNVGEVVEDASCGAELHSFRVRVQANSGPRTRLLTLTAANETEARALAIADLDDSWAIVDVRRAPMRQIESSLFRGVASALEALTDLSALEARGTLSLALKAAGFSSRDVGSDELELALSDVVPAELKARGITDADQICEQVRSTIH
jgi:hypothetical protein